MVGDTENILVEFDYNNITIVDPNKVIDINGNAKERFIKQEDLVFYANLECKVLPRTKLAVGVANNDQIQTVSIATINFLKPGDKTFLDNSYTDEITGKNSVTGEGVNQPKKNSISNPNKPADFFLRQSINSGGKPGATDNGLLGITSINIRQGLDFLPTINVQLEDVKGKALFESGDNSPYAAFFNLPYPLFHLTIKGYYGKAIKLGLMLQSFSSRYDTYSGNFKIDLKFYTYKYTILSEITMAALTATPHMYKSRIKVQTTQGSTDSKFVKVEDGVVEGGYQKVKEMYSEYKSKGMIPDDFPEITLVQMQERIENFIKNVLDSFTKQNLDPLTNLDVYQKTLNDYSGNVYYFNGASWFEKYMDKNTAFVLTNGNKVYTFKPEISLQNRVTAKAELDGHVKKYNELLDGNETVGVNGSYKINNKTTKITIPNGIKSPDTFIPKPEITEKDIDLVQSYRLVKGVKTTPTDIELAAYQAELIKNKAFNSPIIQNEEGDIELIKDYYIFEGTNTFIDNIDKMGKKLKVFREQIQEELTKALSELLQSKDNGIGFVPNIRNVLAVVFANGEAFLRLMDDVHTKAWDKRDSTIRKNSIFNSQTAGASQDNLSSGNNKEQPIYPWPQMIKETSGTDGHEKFEIVYPGDSSVITQTKGFLADEWPEVEFVEEFIRGYVERTSPPSDSTASPNELTEPQRISVDAIEFPIKNDVYGNKEEVKFFYEIYERVLLTTFYSRLGRCNDFISDSDKVTTIIADAENINILKSLSNDNPFIIQKLKEYAYTGENFETVLRHISNEGLGESWQNFIRGIFNTKYIKNLVNNSSFEFINEQILKDSLSQPMVSLPSETQFAEYINDSTTSNEYDFADTYPFTNKNWVKKYLANSNTVLDEKSAFDTTQILTYTSDNKIITNIKSYDSGKKPFTNFISEITVTPTEYSTTVGMKAFYETRKNDYKNQLFTEGNLKYNNYNGLVTSEQTVSMFNTPYFINAIQQGVSNFRNFSETPYIEAAYLFLNSLPLSTLREKYKTKNESDDLNYIFATLNKFGGVHKIPYSWVLKYGSIWHRYKKYVETGVDIIGVSWANFDYLNNYDPVNSLPSTIYTFSASSQIGIVDIVLENNVTIGGEVSTTINTGFYPKLINDFNVFYQGFEIFSAYTSTAIQEGIKSGFTLNYVDEAIISKSEGFDTSIPNRDLRIFPWTVSVNTLDNISSFIFPSQGSLVNQTNNECFDANTGEIKFEVMGNKSMYDGSVRTFWTAPNYGYFDDSKIVKVNPDQYLKEIFSGKSSQENYSLNGVITQYSNISEMFSVFEKDVLDLFEVEFLNFSKSKYDYSSEGVGANDSNTAKLFKNFQVLMIELMKLPKITGSTGEDYVRNAQSAQLTNITNLLTRFINNDVVFKNGNPSNYDKKLFYTFSNYDITDPYILDKYTLLTPNALPVNGGTTTLSSSKSLYPNEWTTLETYVGFSEIPQLVYGNNGSYITDFFVDLNISFTVNNIINFSPIIKIYATQKLKESTMNKKKFIGLMDEYLKKSLDFKNKIFNNLIIKLQKALPDVNNTVQTTINSVLEGPQTKVELWESFKAINDKWISGNDFKTKTLFEDVLLLDRASRNIGDKILVDVFKLKNRLININPKATMLSFVQSILVENNFVVMNLPSYVNFYNVQDAVKNPKPKVEGTLEFANTLFGTFMNVDYRESSAKMVCFFGGKPSEQLDLKNNVDFRYRNDAFDLRRASDNPLVEDLTNKNDWDKSNKVVGFNVDIGPQNQSMFYGFTVSQDAGQATAESLEVLNQMANQGGNRGGATQSNSLYNLYKNRSYSCNVSMMGNAMIQPTMYFNLRYVPMFSGPYMITSVNHSISPGSFETIIEGIRQPTASLPKIDNYLQTLKTNLLQSIIEKNKLDTQKKNAETKVNSTNVIGQSTEVNNQATQQDSTTANDTIQETCQPNSKYAQWAPLTGPSVTTLNYKSVIGTIVSLTNDIKLQKVIFSSIYISSNNNNTLTTYENNFAGITIDQDWGESSTYFVDKYFYCSSQNIPNATFSDLTQSVTFLVKRWSQRMSLLSNDSASEIAKFWILNANTSVTDKKLNPVNVYDQMSSIDKGNIETKVQSAINEFNTQTGQLNVGSTPPVIPPLIDTYTYAVTTPPLFENLKVIVDPSVDGLRNIFQIEYGYKITAECHEGSGSGQQFGTNYVSTNKQKFEIDLQGLLTESGCNNVSKSEYTGTYNYQITVFTKPVKPDGSLDTSRNDFYKSYPVTFTL